MIRRLWWRLVGWRLYLRRVRKTPAWKAAAATGQFNELMKVLYPQSRVGELAARPWFPPRRVPWYRRIW